MKKHLLMLFLLSRAKSDTISEMKVLNDSEKLNTTLPSENKQLSVLKTNEQSEHNTQEKALPVLKAYEESAPKTKDNEKSLKASSEESLPILQAYEELLPVLKTYEQYFTVLEEKQKKLYDYKYIALQKESENFKTKAAQVEKQLKNNIFKIDSSADVEYILNSLYVNFKIAYLKYFNQIKKSNLSYQDQNKFIIEANILYSNTVASIKKNYPIEKQIQKLKKQKKEKNLKINNKIKKLRFLQNEKIRRLDEQLLKKQSNKLKSNKPNKSKTNKPNKPNKPNKSNKSKSNKSKPNKSNKPNTKTSKIKNKNKE